MDKFWSKYTNSVFSGKQYDPSCSWWFDSWWNFSYFEIIYCDC